MRIIFDSSPEMKLISFDSFITLTIFVSAICINRTKGLKIWFVWITMSIFPSLAIALYLHVKSDEGHGGFFLEQHSFDWVTKAKRNTALFRKETHPLTGRERFVPVNPRMLIQQVFPSLTQQGSSGLVGTSIPNMFMKMPVMVANRKGEQKKKQQYTAIGVVVAIRLKEDEELEQTQPEENDEDQPASYRGAYVLISNRVDVPDEVFSVYAKRWRIESFFVVPSKI